MTEYLNMFISSLTCNLLYCRLNDCIELLEDMEENGLLDMDKVSLYLLFSYYSYVHGLIVKCHGFRFTTGGFLMSASARRLLRRQFVLPSLSRIQL